VNGTCVKSTPYDYEECESNEDCDPDYTNGVCECNHVTGKKSCGVRDTIDQCSKEWISAYKCYERKKCAPIPGSVMYSCVQEQCTSETNDLLSCRTSCNSYRGELMECAANLILRNCPKFPMWARIVTAFTILLAAVLVIFIVYGVSIMRAKKRYSHLSS